ncbi:MAG: hypothetical protein R3D55_07540 [Chloroflexota bacterium]
MIQIILIGPYGAGKSTLSELIADKFNWKHCSLDSRQSMYLKEMPTYSTNLANTMNTWSITSPNWQRYNLYLIRKFIGEFGAKNADYVLDFGAGHSFFQEESYLSRAKKILKPFGQVILLRPSEDHEESLKLLLQQIRQNGFKGSNKSDSQINKFNRLFLEHPSNRELAKLTIYTKKKTPNETLNEICQELNIV